MFNKWFRRLSLAYLTVASPLAAAQGAGAIPSDWMLCGEPGSPAHPHEPQPFNAKGDEATYLDADESRATNNEIFDFSGDVEVRRGNQRLNADTATYNQAQDTVEAHGNVRFEQDGLTVEGDNAKLELGARHGQVETARYGLVQRHARGESSLLVMEDPNHTRLVQATFTTCNPGHDDWLLHAGDLKLDHEKSIGEARNVWLEFKGVPFLYLPYINFPLNDQRKSGFLTPSFGTSDQVGTDIQIPYYWNIAPQRDATLTTRMMSKRGVQLLGEVRYISPTGSGLTNIGYVPHDNVLDKSRTFLSTHNVWNFAPRWSSGLEFGYVSDRDYFGELGTSLSVASTTHLERRADATYHGDFWSFTGRVQSYQTVDESLPGDARPYQRLPQLLVNLNLPQQAYGSNALFNGEYVHFYRRDSVVGDRVDLQPGVSLPLVNAYGYITPSLNLRYTQYALDQQTAGSGESSPSRSLPVLSLDSGVYLERDMSWSDVALLHTLEPRLYYLYVPYRDQSSLPVFDTNLLDFSYANLFQNNRFSGADRVGDANQITVALTSRLLDRDSGRERFNARVGQIFYFDDRRVVLPGASTDTLDVSDIVAELNSTGLIPDWKASASLLWNPQSQDIDKSALGFEYKPDNQRILKLDYRLRRNELEQTDLAALWPLSQQADRRINMVGRWNYSLQDGRTLEALLGMEYDTCCWALRVAGRRFVSNVGGDTNNALFLQLELKGLTSFGNRSKRGLAGLLDPGTFRY